MSTATRPIFNRDQGFLLKVMVVWLLAIVIGCNIFTAELQATSNPALPFGVVQNKEGTLLQDFGYNMLFLRGINDHLIEHPYRLDDQEVLMRHLLPTLTGGMSHAYSPVTLVIVQPLLLFPGQGAYLAFIILSALGIYFLFRLCLLPRAIDRLPLLALVICALSLWFPSAFLVGQTSILTVTLVGFGWWLLRENAAPPPPLHRRPDRPAFLVDLHEAQCRHHPVHGPSRRARLATARPCHRDAGRHLAGHRQSLWRSHHGTARLRRSPQPLQQRLVHALHATHSPDGRHPVLGQILLHAGTTPHSPFRRDPGAAALDEEDHPARAIRGHDLDFPAAFPLPHADGELDILPDPGGAFVLPFQSAAGQFRQAPVARLHLQFAQRIQHPSAHRISAQMGALCLDFIEWMLERRALARESLHGN